MGEAKRRGTFEQRKNSASERFNENTEEVINKMIEFGIYEKSLENADSFLVHGNFLFAWKNGVYVYYYVNNPTKMGKLLETFYFINSQNDRNPENFKKQTLGNNNSISSFSDFEITSNSPAFSKMVTEAFGDDQEIIKTYE